MSPRVGRPRTPWPCTHAPRVGETRRRCLPGGRVRAGSWRRGSPRSTTGKNACGAAPFFLYSVALSSEDMSGFSFSHTNKNDLLLLLLLRGPGYLPCHVQEVPARGVLGRVLRRGGHDGSAHGVQRQVRAYRRPRAAVQERRGAGGFVVVYLNKNNKKTMAYRTKIQYPFFFRWSLTF